MTPDVPQLSFFDHLEELRARLLKYLVVFLAASGISYYFSEHVLTVVIQPVGRLIFTFPPEAFLARLTLSFLGGFFLSLPYGVYQIWRFVSLGLTLRERRYILFFGPLSFVCFVAGALFGYLVMIPVMMKFFLSFSTEVIVPMITVDKYISFVGSMMLASGVVFELPVVLLFLAKIGIATPAFLIHCRPYMLVGILIVSAFLTPPDIISMAVMALPLLLLYEVGILAARWVSSGKKDG